MLDMYWPSSAEKALAFCDNDVDAALSMLLQAKNDAEGRVTA
mgnify:CR=1 FL=1